MSALWVALAATVVSGCGARLRCEAGPASPARPPGRASLAAPGRLSSPGGVLSPGMRWGASMKRTREQQGDFLFLGEQYAAAEDAEARRISDELSWRLDEARLILRDPTARESDKATLQRAISSAWFAFIGTKPDSGLELELIRAIQCATCDGSVLHEGDEMRCQEEILLSRASRERLSATYAKEQRRLALEGVPGGRGECECHRCQGAGSIVPEIEASLNSDLKCHLSGGPEVAFSRLRVMFPASFQQLTASDIDALLSVWPPQRGRGKSTWPVVAGVATKVIGRIVEPTSLRKAWERRPGRK